MNSEECGDEKSRSSLTNYSLRELPMTRQDSRALVAIDRVTDSEQRGIVNTKLGSQDDNNKKKNGEQCKKERSQSHHSNKIIRPLKRNKQEKAKPRSDRDGNWQNEADILPIIPCCNIIGGFNSGGFNDSNAIGDKSEFRKESMAVDRRVQQENRLNFRENKYFTGSDFECESPVVCCYKQFCLAKRGLFCSCAKHMSLDKVIGENEEIVTLREALENNAIFRELSYSIVCDFMNDRRSSSHCCAPNYCTTNSNTGTELLGPNVSSISNSGRERSTTTSFHQSSSSFLDTSLSNQLHSPTQATIECKRGINSIYSAQHENEDQDIRAVKFEALKRRRERTKELQMRKKRMKLTESNENSGYSASCNISSSSSDIFQGPNKENANPVEFTDGNAKLSLYKNMMNSSEECESSSYLEDSYPKKTSSQLDTSLSDPEHYRRYSTRFTKQQTAFMRSWYDLNRHNPYASEKTIEKLAEDSSLPARSVRKWLSNRRTRLLETRTYRKMKNTKTCK
ncbi:MAG: hypothetical protein MHMPM18_001418 [Marteilia pararefringens]